MFVYIYLKDYTFNFNNFVQKYYNNEIFISPAKKINEEKVVFDNYKSTKFHFDKEVKYLVNELKDLI